MFVWVHYQPSALKYVAINPQAAPMAQDLYRALVELDYLRRGHNRREFDGEGNAEESLAGLVYGVTPIPHDGSKGLFQKPIFWAIVVITVFFILNIVFF